MHLQLLHTVEIFLAFLTRKGFFRLPLDSPASPQGWNDCCLLQDVLRIALDMGRHGDDLRVREHGGRRRLVGHFLQVSVLSTTWTQEPGRVTEEDGSD